MQACKIIKLECPKWEEAWNLFKLKVGEDTLSDSRIRGLAEVLAREYDGLPLALITVGLAMSMKKMPEEWKHAITLLKRSRMAEISACSLWPEDKDILKANIIKAWLGIGLIDDFDDISEAYSMGHSIIENLKAICLLEPGYSADRYVRMHKVIRGMALWIVSERGSNENKWLVQANTKQAGADHHEWNKAERVSLMNPQTEMMSDSCVMKKLMI